MIVAENGEWRMKTQMIVAENGEWRMNTQMIVAENGEWRMKTGAPKNWKMQVNYFEFVS